MQLRCRDLEWWMRRRQLPSRLRHRVRHYEHQRWATMGGEDEMELIKDLPEGLRRDIKRHLCVDLIRKVTGRIGIQPNVLFEVLFPYLTVINICIGTSVPKPG